MAKSGWPSLSKRVQSQLNYMSEEEVPNGHWVADTPPFGNAHYHMGAKTCVGKRHARPDTGWQGLNSHVTGSDGALCARRCLRCQSYWVNDASLVVTCRGAPDLVKGTDDNQRKCA